MPTSPSVKRLLVGAAALTAISAAFALGFDDSAPAAMALASTRIDAAMLHARQLVHEQAEAATMVLAALAAMALIVKRRAKGGDS